MVVFVVLNVMFSGLDAVLWVTRRLLVPCYWCFGRGVLCSECSVPWSGSSLGSVFGCALDVVFGVLGSLSRGVGPCGPCFGCCVLCSTYSVLDPLSWFQFSVYCYCYLGVSGGCQVVGATALNTHPD